MKHTDIQDLAAAIFHRHQYLSLAQCMAIATDVYQWLRRADTPEIRLTPIPRWKRALRAPRHAYRHYANFRRHGVGCVESATTACKLAVSIMRSPERGVL